MYVALSRVGSFDDVLVFVAYWKDAYVCIHIFDKDVLDALSAETRLTINVVYKGILTKDIFNDMMICSLDEDDAAGDILEILLMYYISCYSS